MWGGRKIGRKGDGGGGESPNPHLLFANKILFCHFPIVRAPILKDITPGVGGVNMGIIGNFERLGQY